MDDLCSYASLFSKSRINHRGMKSVGISEKEIFPSLSGLIILYSTGNLAFQVFVRFTTTCICDIFVYAYAHGSAYES